MEKLEYIEKYKINELLPLDEFMKESKRLAAKYNRHQFVFLLLGILSLIVTGVFFLILYVKYGGKSVSGGDTKNALLYLVCFAAFGGGAILLLICYFVSRANERKEKNNSPVIRKIKALGSEIFYNRIIELQPSLKGLEIIAVTDDYRCRYNPDFLAELRSLQINPKLIRGGHIVFSYKGLKYAFTIEYVHERVVTIHSKNHTTYIYYHTFVDALMQPKAITNNHGIFYLSTKKFQGGQFKNLNLKVSSLIISIKFLILLMKLRCLTFSTQLC
ncbi:hypothetical protein SCLARK_00616 [Spiroplasma clarkii]|uniref:hypothetical protein n=1 Tax=Spiroplasma clarkii TaxID=2139 RepID=UPI000B56D1A9|nr:hypothetical protein [Spiroplasma clarkii]ARU91285.1 hypothetical protein SCLARK_00616 [Spiroplasma clarkii]